MSRHLITFIFTRDLMALSNYCIVQDSWWNHKRSPIPWLILSIWFIFTLWSTRQSCVFMSGLLPLLFMNLAITSLRLLCNGIFGTRKCEKLFSWGSMAYYTCLQNMFGCFSQGLWHLSASFRDLCWWFYFPKDETRQWRTAGYGKLIVGFCLSQLHVTVTRGIA